MAVDEHEIAESIRIETEAKYPIGTRIKLSAFGKSCSLRKHFDRLGTVRGYKRGGLAVEGVMAFSCLQINWDGNKGITSLHRSHVELSS